uniref:Uncharacterized protein n=1 Tax=Quercus lobata TaxID=97700 RepID=A0A7N2KN99_QUELO
MEIVDGLLGKLVRHCYAVLCLGVLLLSVTIAHYVPAAEPSDPRERTIRRLRASHGRSWMLYLYVWLFELISVAITIVLIDKDTLPRVMNVRKYCRFKFLSLATKKRSV